jgi:hypothetical protein
MKTPLTFLVLFIFWMPLHAQDIEWFQQFSSVERDGILEVVVDQESNVITTVFYEGPITVAGQNVSHEDDMDFLVGKFNADGELLWVQAFTGSGFDRGNSLVVDDENNIYLGAHFSGTLTMAGQTITGTSGNEILIVKLTPEGQLDWYKTFEGPGSDICYGLYWDEEELLAVGHYDQTLNLDGIVLESSGQLDMWVASLDPENGGLNWARSFGGEGTDRLYQITKDTEGNLYTVGYFEDFIELAPNIDLTAGEYLDPIILKLSDTGDPIWARSGSSTGSSVDQAFDISVDDEGNSYVAGFFYGSIIFDNSEISGGDSSDGFVVSFDADGDYRWALSTQTEGNGGVFRIVEGAEGKQAVIGNLSNGGDLQGGTQNMIQETGFFFAEINPDDGAIVHQEIFDGTSNDFGGQIAYDPLLKSYYLTASFDDSLMIKGDQLESIGDLDALLFRFNTENVNWVHEEMDGAILTQVQLYHDFTNRSAILHLEDPTRFEQVSIVDLQGRIHLRVQPEAEWQLPVEQFASGMYFIRVEAKGIRITKRLIIP